jgi:hypothetical protein
MNILEWLSFEKDWKYTFFYKNPYLQIVKMQSIRSE